jgi:uncharacterized membrane protein YsdA (DUF1294 family)
MTAARRPIPRRSAQATFLRAAVILSVVLLAGLSLFTPWPRHVIWLAALSLVTFLLWGYDKFQAKAGGGRVPEIVLLGLTLAGGAVGAGLGMLVFRHKIRKPVFWVVLAGAAILQAVILFSLYR